MSEAEWLTEPSLRGLTFDGPQGYVPTARKLRLYGVACCRWASEFVEDPDFPDVIDAAEWMADHGRPGRWPACVHRLDRRLADPTFVYDVGEDELRSMAEAVAELLLDNPPASGIRSLCQRAAFYGGGDDPLLDELLLDILGNPFRPVAFDPTWRTGTVAAVAADVYADRAFDRLPVLADALEDAGCDAAELLAHLRGPGQHVRGCWALDLVLGKS